RKIQSNLDKFSDFDEKINEADYNLRKAEENYSLYQSVVRNELPEEIADKIVKISDGKQLNIKQAGEVIEIMEDVNKTIELGIRDAKDIFLKKKKLYPLFSFLLLFAGLGVSLYSLISIKYLFLIPGIAFVFTSFIFGYLTIINNRNFEDFTRIANPYGDPIIILGIGALNMYIEYSLKISNFLENFEDLRVELENVRYREALSKLRERYNKYKELERLNTENKKAVLAASDEISETRKKINDILFSHEITENCDVYETMNMLQNIRREVEATQKYIEEDLRNLEKKEKAYGIEKDYEYEFLPVLSEIEDEMVSKNREINRLEKTLDELREEIDNKEVLSLQLSELNEKAEKYKNETYILKCTAELIEKTNEALMDKYFKPVFESYKELEKNFLSNNIVPGMKIRKDYSLSFEIEGKETNEKHLSTGQQICAKVLLKYAIVKMMFKSDKPFVILDDPFATLDEKNLEDAKKLVKTLSKDMQTFYFTCHKSRAI
ncbi:MAG: hypothetical protein MJ113_01790, partial [Lachnospiraceae bacterium]|nr:hypothetical protein [Lachnospiraceae bacterium]